jgi:hypothetical protein
VSRYPNATFLRSPYLLAAGSVLIRIFIQL